MARGGPWVAPGRPPPPLRRLAVPPILGPVAGPDPWIRLALAYVLGACTMLAVLVAILHFGWWLP